MKTFNQFIKEGYNDQFSEEYDSRDNELVSKPVTYKIYTSAHGIVEFDDSILKPYGKEENKFFIDREWREQLNIFNSAMDVVFDKNQMFIFIETYNGDFAEYKVFTD